VNFKIEYLENKILEAQNQLLDIEKREEELANEIKITDEAKRLLEMLKTAKVKVKKDFILDVINNALLDIFDQDIKLEIRSSDEDQKIQEKQTKLNIKYDIILLENGIEIGRNEKLLTSNGGGVLSVISLLLKILTGYIYSKNKFYIFDESLAQVSEIYQERLSLFLKEFCKTYKFTIVLINHNPKLASHADMAYILAASQLSNGLKKLKIEKLDDMRETNDVGEIVKNNSYEIEIENFQSIDNLKFEFDGFVSITGANNIGKSAVVRSVNSIIFNSFHETYLRQGAKQTRIKINHDDKWAEMIYKSKKIYYTFWDGEEVSGKKLAQDKIQEKMEQIGFKFLNVGQKYKNWKADVRDQVDRLYVTTQYDKMYLIGSKSNDSDKLFNFLFDAEVIAQALLNANYDLRILQQEQKDAFNQKRFLETEIETLKKKLKIEKYYFLRELVGNIKSKNNIIDYAKQEIEITTTLLNKYNTIIRSFNILNKYKNSVLEIEKLEPIKNKGIILITKVKNILDKLKNFSECNNVVGQYKTVSSQLEEIEPRINKGKLLISKFDIVTETLKKYKNALDIRNRYYQVIEKITNGESAKAQLTEWWDNYKNSLDIVECEKCGGLGYHVR